MQFDDIYFVAPVSDGTDMRWPQRLNQLVTFLDNLTNL